MTLTFFNALDLSNLKTSSEISNRFSELAECLLLHYKLCIEDSASQRFEFQLLEIEFYLHFPGIHEDPFCHSHVNQTKSGQWYFHRVRTGAKKDPLAGSEKSKEPETKAGGYRGGTRKGVDIAFGNPITSSFFPSSSSSIHGGILLRSMRSLSSQNEIISGPSLLVDKILELTRSENIAELVNHKLKGHLIFIDDTPGTVATTSGDKSAKLYLRSVGDNLNSPLTTEVCQCSPRVGLELSHPSISPTAKDPYVSFVGKMYRYFIQPDVLKSSLRYYNIIWYLSRRDFINSLGEGTLTERTTELLARLGKETCIRRMHLEKYITAFRNGHQKQDLRNFVGSIGKGTSSNPIKFLTMIGVLCRLGLLDEP